MPVQNVVKRYEHNPILSAEDISYPATLIFNAGVAKYQGRYVMVFRNDYGGKEGNAKFEGTNIGLAFSDDGINWQPRKQPWIQWQTDEILRAYDPRITVIDGRCYMCFAVDTRHGVRGGVAVTDDFDKWDVLSLSAPDNRNMVLFPEKLNGKFMRLERPFSNYGRESDHFDLWFADSPDVAYWGNNQLLLASEHVPWANQKIGPGAPPIKTKHGWLTLFHAVNRDDSKELPAWHAHWHATYTAGLMLLDLQQPWKIKAMYKQPFMVPEEPYELEGFRGSVLFPGGLILEPDGQVKIYYGAADTVECLATANVDDLLKLCLES
ncbi:MAG: glycoside hydrolase family 130 protein [Sedimentisphaerales bacterium]|nr:glycoside hydrolase family 130 protein [Sedimentisphaerales bacterium]